MKSTLGPVGIIGAWVLFMYVIKKSIIYCPSNQLPYIMIAGLVAVIVADLIVTNLHRK